MKQDRGKAAAMETTYVYNNDGDMPCMKHPSSYSIGICSYCLKERLENLLCSECGEQRLSSCSCSDDHISSSYRNSCSVEVGSVGRISFLLENEKNTVEKNEHVILLSSSSSSNCVEIKKSQNGFWKIKRLLFRKKKEKGHKGVDEKSDIVVSRSRSLCSFRNGGDDDGSDHRFSSVKISDFDEPRKSENGCDFKNLRNKGIFQVKESDFITNMDESAFIDLNLLDEPKSVFSAKRLSSNVEYYGYDSAASTGNLRSGSCRIQEVNEYDRRIKRGNKVWKWIFGQTSSTRRKSTSNIDENSNLIIKP